MKVNDISDGIIREYLYREGSGPPKETEDSGYVRFSRQHISRRYKKFVDYGLPNHLGNGVYMITDEGEQYLEGELDTTEMTPEDEKS